MNMVMAGDEYGDRAMNMVMGRNCGKFGLSVAVVSRCF
jgi:hypothetical protein